MVDKAKLAKILRALAQIVESSTYDELEELERYSVSELLAAGANSDKMKAKRPRPLAKTEQLIDIPGIVESLRHLSSREDGINLLELQSLNKRALEQVARHLDLPVLREDTSGRLIQKIVEAILGPRLNSEAIRGGSRRG